MNAECRMRRGVRLVLVLVLLLVLDPVVPQGMVGRNDETRMTNEELIPNVEA
jgi:Tfp pilus assembly protein PilX